MKRLLLFLVVLNATPLLAQEPQPATVRKLVKVQHVNAGEVGNLLQWIRYYPSRELGTIILEGSAEDVAKAEEIIHAVDQPGTQSKRLGGVFGEAVEMGEAVEIDAYFLSAGAALAGGPVPPLVMSAVTELQKRFSYTQYGLLDSTLVRVSIASGPAQVQGQFARTEGGPVSYSLRVEPTRVVDGTGGESIRLSNLIAEWKIPYQEQVTNFETGQTSKQNLTRDLRIETNVVVPEGKLVVVGKAGSPTSAEAIFLVLRARIVE